MMPSLASFRQASCGEGAGVLDLIGNRWKPISDPKLPFDSSAVNQGWCLGIVPGAVEESEGKGRARVLCSARLNYSAE